MNLIRPTWLYRPVNVPEIRQIQEELQPIIQTLSETMVLQAIDLDAIKRCSPSYCDLIDRLGLSARWFWTGAVVAPTPGAHIHSDHPDWHERCYAFNIPLVNCENGCTVWYDAKNPIESLSTAERPYVFYDDEGAAEIGRMSANTCAFVNISVPHKPVSLDNRCRMVMTTRFHPEIFDYFD